MEGRRYGIVLRSGLCTGVYGYSREGLSMGRGGLYRGV